MRSATSSARLLIVVTTAALALAAFPGRAYAQAFGIGPRFSFVRGDVGTGAPSTRFFGGTMRIRSSKHVALEGSMDFRSETSLDGLSRTRQRPLQGSLLIFPVRSTISPYLLGGFGLYKQTFETLNPSTGGVSASTSASKTGWHVGAGAEIGLGKHAAFFADYRWRFVHFGAPAIDEQPINVPIVDSIKLSHKGSMWTSGMAFYF